MLEIVRDFSSIGLLALASLLFLKASPSAERSSALSLGPR
jgi:hypothetical protein